MAFAESEEFRKLESDENKITELLSASGVITNRKGAENKFEFWKNAREFIASSIIREGTLLDVGCGGGLLLCCLMEWSKYRIEPYGIDNDEKRVELAKKSFPSFSSNIYYMSYRDHGKIGDRELFDFVYWNVWENLEPESERGKEALKLISGRVAKKGRLILGFYPNDDADNEKDHKKAEQQAEQLKALGFVSYSLVQNQRGREFIALFEKFAS